MVEEDEVIKFLKENQGQASLEQISEGLKIPKYGPKSAYALLQSLRSRNLVDRKGEQWVLVVEKITSPTTKEEKSARPQPEEQKKAEAATEPEVEEMVKAMARNLAEAMKTARTPADEWEPAAV